MTKIKNRGAALACLALLVLGSYAVWLCFAAAPCAKATAGKVCAEKPDIRFAKNSSPLLNIQRWIVDNGESIEPLAGIAGLLAAIVLATAAMSLRRTTRTLAASTVALHDAARLRSNERPTSSVPSEHQSPVATRQTDLAEKQYNLQRIQFLAEHRPRLQLRHVGMVSPQPGPVVLQTGHPIKGSLVIVNIGGSEAKIHGAVYRFYWSNDGLPMLPPLGDGNAKALLGRIPHILPAHGSCTVEIESHEPLDSDPGLATFHLYIMGAVSYADWDDNKRWMGFCREYERPSGENGEGRFIPVFNPDYEYED
jgi:hypothetical protein